MSDSILYLGIVAIWAVFLVPALLRRPHAAGSDVESEAADLEADPLAEVDRQREPVEYASDRAFRHSAKHLAVEFEADVYIEAGANDPEYHYDVHVHDGYGPGGSGSYVEPPAAPYPQRPSQGRQQMLRARRRMLSVLIGLVLITAGFVAAGYVRWWICIPPISLLTLYVLLLREIAQADAEHVRRAAQEARAARDVWQRAHQAWEASKEARAEPTAQVIDISGRRMRDQLYDQYADAAVRAVGD